MENKADTWQLKITCISMNKISKKTRQPRISSKRYQDTHYQHDKADAGLRHDDRQAGQTGKRVASDIYFASVNIGDTNTQQNGRTII